MPTDTNRTVYQRILVIGESTDRSLEEYLRALRHVAWPQRERETLPVDVFVTLLDDAATVPAPPFDDALRTEDLAVTEDMPGFEVWDRVIRSQIVDLRDLAEGPAPRFPELGVDVCRPADAGRRACGTRWYNHAVAGYLECAMAGALGGWDAADGVRGPVPGPVAPLFPEPPGVAELRELTWAEFTDFLVCGQEYE